MIQRIQTVYLFLIAALGIILCFVPVVQFVTPAASDVLRVWNLNSLGLQETTNTGLDPVQLKGVWGLFVTTILIAVLAFVNIFLYKRRMLQARINIFLALLCIGYYGVLAIFIWLATTVMNVEWHILPWTSIPLVCFILTLMATRRILKDEALVRAADRLR